MKYTVHVYAVVRVPLKVEADSQVEAMKQALNDFSLDGMLRDPADDAEEVTGFLVDEEGDDDFQRTRSYGPDMSPLTPQ